MSDAIELLALAAHPNLATVYVGATPTLAGYRSGSVPIASQMKGSAIDVSGYATLRLELLVTAMSNRHGYENGLPHAATLHVTIERQVLDGWEPMHEFLPTRTISSQSRVFSSGEFSNPADLANSKVRASYFYVRHAGEEGGILDGVSFTFGLAGEALPEAEE